jgi:uncharacterized protein
MEYNHSDLIGDDDIPEVVMRGTHHIPLKSRIRGATYHLSVSLPWNYYESEKRYPVLYVNDSDTQFKGFVFDYFALNWDQEIPDLIIVGIGYDTNLMDGIQEFVDRRTADYVPRVASDLPGSGSGEGYAGFIRGELLPFVDANYRTVPEDRTICGGSLAGFFCTYMLLHPPHVFTRYLICSPSLSKDSRVMFDYEKVYAEANNDLPAIVYTSEGSLEPEDVAELHEFVSILGGRDYPRLRLETEIMEDWKHGTAQATAYFHGLKAIFKGDQ